jgi:hypothetical protein
MFTKLLEKIRQEFGDENNNTYIPNRSESQRRQRRNSPTSIATDIYSIIVDNPELNDYLDPIPSSNTEPITNPEAQEYSYFNNWLNNYFDNWFYDYYITRRNPLRMTGNFIKQKEIKIILNKNKKENEDNNNNNNNNNNNKKECCICLNDNIEREKIVRTKCNHEYCNICIVRWCGNKENNIITCPTCRTKISELYVNNKSMISEIKNDLYNKDTLDDNINEVAEEVVLVI